MCLSAFTVTDGAKFHVWGFATACIRCNELGCGKVRVNVSLCIDAHQKGYNKCQTRSVSAPVIEQAVVDQIRGIAANPEVVGEVVRQMDEQRIAGIEGLEREKRVIEKELRRLGEETASLIRITGNLDTDRMAELQDRVLVLERLLRDVRDQFAEIGAPDGGRGERAEDAPRI